MIRYEPKYTVADYEQWEGDWELWNGVAVAMTPSPLYSQQRLLARLLVPFELALRSMPQLEVVTECDWRIDEQTVVRPDLSVVEAPVTTDFISSPPVLVAEVLSASTRQKDRTVKWSLYQTLGVRYYLILDPDQRTFALWHWQDGAYHEVASEPTIELEFARGRRVAVDIHAVWES